MKITRVIKSLFCRSPTKQEELFAFAVNCWGRVYADQMTVAECEYEILSKTFEVYR